MNKNNLIDAGMIFLQGANSAPPEIRQVNDPRVIEKMLGLAIDTYFNSSKTYKDEKADEEGKYNWKYDQFTKAYFQPILKDERRNKLYAELPVQIFSVNNNQGVRLVCPSKEESTAFIPRRQLGTFLMDGLDVNTMGLIYYTLEGRNIYFSGNINDCWTEVMMKLAVKFEELEGEDFINIPDGDTGQIFQFMLQIMMGKNPSDISDDNTPEQNQK
tara:strand:+ start:4016 stop:4660 length:645 start_codon:yes stop_codon:yes gene_type:complete